MDGPASDSATHEGGGIPVTVFESLTPEEIAMAYREHAPALWRLLRRLGASKMDVEDLAHETFLVALRSKDRFERRSSLKTWLFGIGVRVVALHRRQRAHRPVVADLEKEQDEMLPHDDAAERTAARMTIDRLLEDLDEDKRIVFVLFEIVGLSMKEVAETAGIPLKTAYSRLYAGHDQIQAAARRYTARDGR